MFNYVDLALLALVLFFIITGIRKGFARTLLSFVGRIASLIVAYFVSDMYADVVYEKFIKEALTNAIESNVNSALTEGVPEKLNITWSELPQIFTSIVDKLGLEISQLDTSGMTQGVSSTLEETIAGPIAIVICRIIIFAIVSVVASFVISILVNLLCKIVKLPILKTADKLLGAGLGLVNGLICVFILSFVFTVVSGFISPSELSDEVNSSYIIDLFANANILL